MDNGLEEVCQWLVSIHLNDCIDTFVSHGFHNIQKCCFITPQYLNELEIPAGHHDVLLNAVNKLKEDFPHYYMETDPMCSEPPPLPVKKNRKSGPSSNQAQNSSISNDVNNTRKSFPPTGLVPPAAPKRSSILTKQSPVPPHRHSSKQAVFISPPPPTSAEEHLLDLIPPPPPDQPPVSPEVKRKKSFPEDIIDAMPPTVKEFLTNEEALPALMNEGNKNEPVQAEEQVNEKEQFMASAPKKPKPPIIPRPKESFKTASLPIKRVAPAVPSPRASTLPPSPIPKVSSFD